MGRIQFWQVVHHFYKGIFQAWPSVRIQRRKVSIGEISMTSVPGLTISFRRPRFHVQLRSNFHCLLSSRRCISIGSVSHLPLTRIVKIHAPTAPTVTWGTIRDSLASMLRSTRSLKKVAVVLYAQADTLHSFAPEHRSMEVQASQIGTSRSTSELSLRIEQQTIDGETNSHTLMSMVLNPVLHHLKRYSSHSAPQQQWCMVSPWLQLVPSMVDARPFKRTRSITSPVHLEVWFRCSVKWSLPTRTVQFQRIYGISTFLIVLMLPSPLSTFIRHCSTMKSPH